MPALPNAVGPLMNRSLSYQLGFAAAVAASVFLSMAFLYWWFAYDPAAGLAVNLPGADGRPAETHSPEPAVNLAGVFQTFSGVPANLPGAWPRFRGPDFDNICKNGMAMPDSWPETGPAVLWSREMLGEGHAAPVVWDGRVYVLDYDEEARADAVRCFSLANGEEIWRRSYAVPVKRNHGMSRTVPAVTGDALVTMGPRCHVVCLDPVTGDFRWGIDLQREYGTVEPLWYTGQCPLIDDGKAILAPCGDETLLMAVDCRSGEVVWETANPREAAGARYAMSHSSVMPMTVAGMRMYVYCALGGAVGVAAEGERTGELLWEVPWNARVIAPSPVPVEGDRIFFTAGYGAGSMMIRLREEDGEFVPEVLFEKGPKDGLACEQQTPIYHAGLLYGIMPKDGGALKEQFVCYDADGRLVWSSGQENRYGLGPFILADGKFYVLSDDGVLTMLRASVDGFEPLARARMLDGHDAWGPLAIAGGRLLLRDSTRMVCVAIGELDGANQS